LHVVDLSNPRFEEQIASVENLLEELELGRIPRLMLFNKTDRLPPAEVEVLCHRFDALPISALNRASFAPLLATLERRFWPPSPAGELDSEDGFD
jgi:GTP-binding protein HflX